MCEREPRGGGGGRGGGKMPHQHPDPPDSSVAVFSWVYPGLKSEINILFKLIK